MSKQIIVVGGLPESLLNFRGDLLSAFKARGFKVTAMSGLASDSIKLQLAAKGIKHIDIPIRRNGLNPVSDLLLFWRFYKTFKKNKPKAVIAYTIKPVIWGGLATRLAGVPFYGLVTGLGFAFQGEGFKRKLLTFVVTKLYSSALKVCRAVVFQNKDNRDVFIERNIVSSEKCHVVNGSGVNISSFQYKAIPDGEMAFLCVARLLKEKGLREYAAAATLVKKKYPQVSFKLVGPEDPSPDGISIEEVRTWSSIDYMGETKDVRPFIEQCHVYVLPSYHEGLPRSTLEAMATGRPVLTTDAVGCRETVETGINGFKVGVSNVTELTERMTWFIENPEKLNEMGKASRNMVEQKFDVNKVNDSILKIMELKS
tara:strand:+ start:232 stop:1341 length:1110 start_codon:yes stop_codon:yes gene_type:complete